MTRPLDTWRVCGEPVADVAGSGCTCSVNDPTRWRAQRALARLAADPPPAIDNREVPGHGS